MDEVSFFDKGQCAMEHSRLDIKDTVVLGGVGGLWLASLYIFPNPFFGAHTYDVLPLSQSIFAVVFTLFSMSLTEYKLMKRKEDWKKVHFAIGLAVALGLSIICGYKLGISDGLWRFAITLPLAFLTLWVSELLLAKKNTEK